MRKNNNLKLSITTSIVLSSLILFLIFLSHRLIICITRTFVYLTGLATMLLMSIFYIFIIGFLLVKFYEHYKCYKNKNYKRSLISITEIFTAIIKIETSLLFTLLSILIILYLLNLSI